MSTTLIVNLRHHPYDIYIGRAGHGQDGYFGNPFRSPTYLREEAIERFRAYFLRRVETDSHFRSRVLELRGKRLGCFCKPQACHGDVLAHWLDAQPRMS